MDDNEHITIFADNYYDSSWFAKSITNDEDDEANMKVKLHRNRIQYPFVSLEYYISKANTIIDRLNIPHISTVLRFQHDEYNIKPIIFIPSEFILHYIRPLLELTVPFTLITVSNQPLCVPYISYPPLCEENNIFSGALCEDIDKLLNDQPYLDKWFTKNPCIVHPKLYPLPIGPKWQWYSRLFYDEEHVVSSSATLFRYFGLKPFALFNNFSHLMFDFSYSKASHELGFDSKDSESVFDEMLKMETEQMFIDKSIISHIHQFSNFVQRKKGKTQEKNSWFLIKEKTVFPGKDRLLYFQFETNNTNKPYYRPHVNIRKQAYQNFIEKGFKPANLRQLSGYLQELSEHKFCLAPPGIGLDTHRTWEALMVGTIPIVLSSPLDKLYEDFPVIIVNSYDAIDSSVLYELYEKIIQQSVNYTFEKLFVHYWNEVIS